MTATSNYKPGAEPFHHLWVPTITVVKGDGCITFDGQVLPSASVFADKNDAIAHAQKWANRMEGLR